MADKLTVMGIDPGLNGAMAAVALIDQHQTAVVRPFSKIDHGWRNGINVKEVCSFYREFECDVVLIEQISPRAGEGVTSAATSGRNYGEILGALQMLDACVISVHASAWKAQLELTRKDKSASIEFCQKMYPGIYLKRSLRCKTLDDNMADAVCIAHAGMNYMMFAKAGINKLDKTLMQFHNYWKNRNAAR